MADMIPIKAVYNLGNSVGLSEFAATDTIPAARVSGLGTAATKNIPATGNASATEVVYGSDTRLSDARTPTSHATTGHSDWPAAVSMTEVGYLDGVTSAIQTQLGSKASLTGAEILTNKTLTSPAVSGGTINNTTIGETTATTGKFTTITASTGILFGTDTAAANTLDDYEEGTWTPNQGSGLTVVGAFTSSGVYTKIGRVVTVIFTIAGATSIAVTAGGVITSNLPFTALTSFDQAGTIFRFGAAGGQCIAGNNSALVYNGAAISAGGALNILITYFV